MEVEGVDIKKRLLLSFMDLALGFEDLKTWGGIHSFDLLIFLFDGGGFPSVVKLHLLVESLCTCSVHGNGPGASHEKYLGTNLPTYMVGSGVSIINRSIDWVREPW